MGEVEKVLLKSSGGVTGGPSRVLDLVAIVTTQFNW